MEKHRLHFLFSTERSGGNLLLRLLDAHSKISAPFPAHFIRLILYHLNENKLKDRNYCNTVLPSLFKELFEIKLGQWKKDSLNNQEVHTSLYLSLRNIYRAEAELKEASFSIVKENQGYQYMGWLQSNFPDSKIIWLIRHPYFIAKSMAKSPNHPRDFNEALNFWKEEQLSYKEQLSGKKVYKVFYEQLLLNPEEELKELCSFLGVDFEEQMFSFHEDPLNRLNAEGVKNWSNLANPLHRKDHFGVDHNRWNDANNVCQKMLQEIGLPNLKPIIHFEEDIDFSEEKLTPDEMQMRIRRSEAIKRLFKKYE